MKQVQEAPKPSMLTMEVPGVDIHRLNGLQPILFKPAEAEEVGVETPKAPELRAAREAGRLA